MGLVFFSKIASDSRTGSRFNNDTTAGTILNAYSGVSVSQLWARAMGTRVAGACRRCGFQFTFVVICPANLCRIYLTRCKNGGRFPEMVSKSDTNMPSMQVGTTMMLLPMGRCGRSKFAT